MKSFTYYDTGNGQDGHRREPWQSRPMKYPDATSTCGYAFPTQVIEAVSTLSRSYTWNCAGGVEVSVTDENSQVTNVAWSDPYYWRPASTTDPAGNPTTFYYQPNSTYSAPWATASFLTFNGNAWEASDIKYLDGLGRVYVDQRAQGPGSSTADTVSYTFDANGRLHSTSMPCSVGLSSTCSTTPATTQTYDALNRPLVTTDGAGELQHTPTYLG